MLAFFSLNPEIFLFYLLFFGKTANNVLFSMMDAKVRLLFLKEEIKLAFC